MKKIFILGIIALLLITSLIPQSISEEPELSDLDELMQTVFEEQQEIRNTSHEENLTLRPYNPEQEPDPDYVDYIPSEVLVGLKKQYFNVSQMNTFLNHPIIDKIEVLNIALVEVNEGTEQTFIDMVESRLDVYFAELNTVGYPRMEPELWEPNDPGFQFQWNLKRIKCVEAWDIEKGDKNIVIAILDTGTDWSHPDLRDNMWINEEEFNGVPNIDDDGNGYTDDIRGWNFVNRTNCPKDIYGHGTGCAGIAAAKMDNRIGIAGIANVSIMGVKIGGQEGLKKWNVAKGICYASKFDSVWVISMSLGFFLFSPILSLACLYANVVKKCLLVAASGNLNFPYVIYPARYRTVISVGASTQDNKRWTLSLFTGSSYGDFLELMAPGAEILSTMPTYEVYLNTHKLFPQNYAIGFATSSAVPHVAGVAALYYSKEQRKKPALCRYKLKKTALDIGEEDWDKETGYGVVQAEEMLDTCVVYLEVKGEGSVSISPEQATYGYGSVVQLIANPSPGRPFIGWEGDLTSTASQEIITLDSDKCITAVFA